jgi:nicotinate-nucleotide pyrophosphorylase (carboxylating)
MNDLNALPLPELYQELAGSGLVARLLQLAYDEDLGAGPHSGDITSETMIPYGAVGDAAVVARSGGVIAGLAALPDLVKLFGGGLTVRLSTADGEAVGAGSTIATLSGPVRQLLAVERTALNLVGRLSGIATRTAEFVRAMGQGHRAALYDTRKTTPGLRVLEKYAVRCGGGRCHRIGLFDAVLIKDNHLAAVPLAALAHTVGEAAARARALRPGLAFVEVEVDSLEQLERVLTLPRGAVDIVLLDNMPVERLRAAVRLRESSAARPQLEASGGVRLETVREIALAGVDRISAGALTHSVGSLDVALDLLPPGARGKAPA